MIVGYKFNIIRPSKKFTRDIYGLNGHIKAKEKVYLCQINDLSKEK